MRRKIITTADGSHTLQLEDWNEQYHSKHGAVQEACHVFIKNGFNAVEANHISILEIGFGTGLNALVTYLESLKTGCSIDYVGVEAYPVSMEEIKKLNYTEQLQRLDVQSDFLKMHTSPWNEAHSISDNFILIKQQKTFQKIDAQNQFNLVYFDAFGARVQPELWTQTIFETMHSAMREGGILVTYAAKGSVRRAMQAVGFSVERLQGPPGKREMLRATKPLR